MRESWKNVFGVLKSPGKVLEIFLTKRMGTLSEALQSKCALYAIFVTVLSAFRDFLVGTIFLGRAVKYPRLNILLY